MPFSAVQSCGRRQLTCAKRAKAFRFEKGELCSSTSACNGTVSGCLYNEQAKTSKGRAARPQLDEDRPCRMRWSAAWAAALRRGLPAKGTTQTPFHITKSAPPMLAGQRANFAPFMEIACSTRAGFRYKARRRQPNILEVYPIHGTYCGR